MSLLLLSRQHKKINFSLMPLNRLLEETVLLHLELLPLLLLPQDHLVGFPLLHHHHLLQQPFLLPPLQSHLVLLSHHPLLLQANLLLLPQRPLLHKVLVDLELLQEEHPLADLEPLVNLHQLPLLLHLLLSQHQQPHSRLKHLRVAQEER